MHGDWEHRELAAKLARLRREAHLSTRQLARLTGFSQSKVNKVELGKSKITDTDVKTWLDVLGVRPEIRNRLVETAARLHGQLVDIRDGGASQDLRPVRLEEVEEWELSCAQLRASNNGFLPHFAQTPEYMEMAWRAGSRSASLPRYMESKLIRQARSFNRPSSSLVCVLSETVLYDRRLPTAAWLSQLMQVRYAIRSTGAEMGFVPMDSAVAVDRCMFTADKFAMSWEMPMLFGTTKAQYVSDCIEGFDDLAKHALWEADAERCVDQAIEFVANYSQTPDAPRL